VNDPCRVATITADAGAATNGLLFPLYVHKVVMTHADGSAQASVLLYDAATVTGTSVITMRANEVTDGTSSVFEVHQQEDFSVPLYCQTGISADIGNSAVVKVYYTRA
jgi:hypothetical protein